MRGAWGMLGGSRSTPTPGTGGKGRARGSEAGEQDLGNGLCRAQAGERLGLGCSGEELRRGAGGCPGGCSPHAGTGTGEPGGGAATRGWASSRGPMGDSGRRAWAAVPRAPHPRAGPQPDPVIPGTHTRTCIWMLLTAIHNVNPHLPLGMSPRNENLSTWRFARVLTAAQLTTATGGSSTSVHHGHTDKHSVPSTHPSQIDTAGPPRVHHTQTRWALCVSITRRHGAAHACAGTRLSHNQEPGSDPATAQMYLEDVTRSERRQTQEATQRVIPFL